MMPSLVRLGVILVPIVALLSSAALFLRMQAPSQIGQTPFSTMATPQAPISEMTVASFNVRYDSSASALSSIRQLLCGGYAPYRSISDRSYPPEQRYGELHWARRVHKVVDTAIFHRWDIFSFQEVLPGQLHDLVGLLGASTEGLPPISKGRDQSPGENVSATGKRSHRYDWAGVPRNDGKAKGEAVPIFWRSDKFQRVGASQGGTGKEGVEHFWLSPTPEVPGSVGWDAVSLSWSVELSTLDAG